MNARKLEGLAALLLALAFLLYVFLLGGFIVTH